MCRAGRDGKEAEALLYYSKVPRLLSFGIKLVSFENTIKHHLMQALRNATGSAKKLSSLVPY
jgi:superfamily II DNA helicase RecQ